MNINFYLPKSYTIWNEEKKNEEPHSKLKFQTKRAKNINSYVAIKLLTIENIEVIFFS